MEVNMTDIQLDALREICNMGAGNATTALSQLLNLKIDMSIPNVNVVPFDDIIGNVDDEKIVIGVIVRVLGEAPGNILIVFDNETGKNLVKNLIGTECNEFDDMAFSVICEIGNIMSATFINTITKFTGLGLTPSVPAVTMDMLGAIVSTTFIEAGQYNDFVLDLDTEFSQKGEVISGHFYYVPMPGSLEKILNTIGLN